VTAALTDITSLLEITAVLDFEIAGLNARVQDFVILWHCRALDRPGWQRGSGDG
jgi:hypothetical protein